MYRSATESKSASGVIASSGANTRLAGAMLVMARAVWVVLVVSSLGLFVISLPVYDQQLQRGCVDLVACGNLPGTLTTPGLQALAASGFAISAYAAVFTIFFALITAIWCLLSFLGWVSLFGFLLLFPNGRLVPRPMGLILLLGILVEFLNNFPSPTAPFDAQWPGGLYLLIFGVLLVAILASHIYRNRRVSAPLHRQQTKWVILAVTAVVGLNLAIGVAYFPFPSFQNPHTLGDVIGALMLTLSFNVVLLLIPLSLGFSMLRYRLYGIDVLINRTLVYGSLTALLALLYFGLIVALQSLFQGMFHQHNAVAIVISTLAIAGLFQPLRRRIQAIIDRRFYRRKYDAAKTIVAFSATLRNEFDLTRLSEHLMAVVGEIMQPSHISLWLRPTEHDGAQ